MKRGECAHVVLQDIQTFELLKTFKNSRLRHIAREENASDVVIDGRGTPHQEAAHAACIGKWERGFAVKVTHALVPLAEELLQFSAVLRGVQHVHVQVTVADLVVEVDGLQLALGIHGPSAGVRREVEALHVLNEAVAFLHKIHSQAVHLGFVAVLSIRLWLLSFDAVEVRVSDLRMNVLLLLPLQDGTQAKQIVVAQMRDEHRVNAVEVPGEIPEASFAAESSVDEEVESTDTKEGGVSVSPREDIEGGAAESDVANDIRRGEKLFHGTHFDGIRKIRRELQQSVDFAELCFRV